MALHSRAPHDDQSLAYKFTGYFYSSTSTISDLTLYVQLFSDIPVIEYSLLYLWLLIFPGDRTIAVCTKLDLMDPGTDALDILYGKGISK